MKGRFGLPGGSGLPGKSAYQIAVENGFVGTEAEWLVSLQGSDGVGVPAGGALGQVLKKKSATDYDTEWANETGGGGGSDVPELHLDFEEAGDEFVYNVPYDMKFTSQVSEDTDATLSIALNTNMPKYTKLTVTATAAGLVSLFGEYVTI